MGPPAVAPRTSLFLIALALLLAATAAVCLALKTCVLLSSAALAGALVLAVTPFAIHLSYRLNVLDEPDARKNHARPMPLLGGPAVLVGFAAAVLFALTALPASALPGDLRSQVIATLVAGAFIALMGVADDKWGLTTGVRFIGQLAAVCLVIRSGVVMSFLPPHPVGQVGEVFLSLVWIVGITNALNFLDGLDGLASGVAAVAAASFGTVAAMTGQPAVAVLSFGLAGAALGFFAFNFKPAAVYLGDSGATFLGFVLACIGIIGDWGSPDRAEDLFVPVIILAVPIYDTIYITVYRFKAGLVHSLSEWAAYVGRDHLHHRLQHLGMRDSRVCLFICLGGVFMGLLAVILKTKGDLDRIDKFLVFILAGIVLVGATILMELGKNRRA